MVARVKNQIKNIFDWYKVISFLCYLVILLILVMIISELDRGLQLTSLRLIMIIAAGFGVLVSAFKKIHPLTTILLTFVSGIITTFIVIGNLFPPLADFSRTAFDILSIYWKSFFSEVTTFPDINILNEKWAVLEQAAGVLFERLHLWAFNLPEPAYDPVSLNLIWGISLWIISFWIFWFVIRKKLVLAGIFPPLIIITNVYRNADVTIVAVFWILGIGLLLDLLANQARNEAFWKKNHLSISLGIRRKTIEYAFSLSLGLVLIAATITSPKLDEFIDDIREQQQTGSGSSSVSAPSVQQGEFQGDIGASKVLGDAAFGRFPNKHLIGSGPDLAETEVMYVTIDDPQPQGSPRYYLRSATYDTYTLHGWLTADKGFILFQPIPVSSVHYSENEKLIYQEVTLLENDQRGNMMYTVGEIAASDVPYYASFHTKFRDQSYTDVFAVVTQETQYSAFSIVPNFGEEELRRSSLDYPSWITSKYLQISEEVPDRVYNLSLRLTATEPTPYDRALAIEQYLRKFEYTLDLGEPPGYQDLVDYFIFESQKGYCDYFASSMVILARAAGIPARLVTGYTTSTYDPETDRYIVTADQAHSWAELYFTGFGWVPFEATPGRPPLERLEEREDIQDVLADQIEPTPPPKPNLAQRFARLIPDNLFTLSGQLIVLIVLGVAASHWVEYLALRSIRPRQMYPKVYARLRKNAKRLRLRIRETDTPLEFSEMLSARLTYLGYEGLLAKVLESTPEEAAMILQYCNQAAYSKHFPSENESQKVVSAFRWLRWRLFLARILVQLRPVSRAMRRFWVRLWQ